EGLPFYKFFYENKIYAQFGYANDLIGEIKKTKDIEKIKHLTEELQNLEIFKNELNGHPRTKTEFDFFESIKDLKAKIKSFEKGLRVGGKIDEKMLKNIEDGISEKMKFSSKIYEKFKKFIDFRWGMGEKIFGQKKENLSPQEKIKLQKISQIDKKLLGLEAEKFLKLEAKNFTPEKISEILKGKSEKFFEAEKKAEKEIVGKIDEIKKFAKENNLNIKSPEIQKKIQKLNDELSKIIENKTKIFKKINELFSGLPEKYQTPELISSIKKFKNGTFLVKIKDGIIQRGKLAVIMGAVMVGTDTFLNREKIAENPEQELAKILQDLGPDMVQLLIDILPFVGTGSNFYAGFTGEESYTGKDVSGGWERTSNFLFGTAGLVMDTLTITGIGATVGIPGRITLAVSKLGLKGKKAEEMTKALKLTVEKISAIAEKTSWMEVAKNFKKILSTKKFQAEKVANYATYGGMATMIGGGAMNYYYSPDGNIEVNKKLEN
ncbi:hypothetical protein LR002_02015, partial [Candidatus Gracilibacteria bacterium]|nr:hypothetical protein [Candidatus Gracilibacteria bacterium]